MKFLGFILSVLLLFGIQLTANQPIPYSGKISIRGVNYDGDAKFTYSLVDKDGKVYWRNGSKAGETIKVNVRNGFYTVLLGGQGMNILPPQLFLDNEELYLKVHFDNGDGQGLRHLEPDQRITATPRALVAEVAKVAKVAELVKDGAITANKIGNKVIGKDQISDSILKYLEPKITAQAETHLVYAETNASFFVQAEGRYLTYQWKKDGVDLIGETNNTLFITDANATNHDGNYSVVVSNDFGSVESGKILVDVNTTWSTDRLVGWWKFDEGSGTVAYDSSGNGNDGNLTNAPTWVTGKIGGALSFDGINDEVITYGFKGIGGSNPRSISAWIKTSTTGVICCYGDKSSNGYKWSFRPNHISTQGFLGAVRIEMTGGNKIASTPVNTNKWHFVCSILPQNSDTVNDILFFVDGSLEKNISGLVDGVINSSLSNDFIIGSQSLAEALYPAYFEGLIDDVRIYDRALSSAEVQALYNLGQ